MSDPIQMSAPDLNDDDRRAVAEVLSTSRLSIGPQVEAFERAIAERIGVQHAIAVSSGTAGLHLAVLAAGIREGDLAITTPFSFVASANVFLYERAVPIFVDVDPLTGNLDPEQVAQALADLQAGGAARRQRLPRRGAEGMREVRTLLAVDVFGQPADYDTLRPIASQYGLSLIEDACEALGAAYRGKQAGTLGDVAVFAFYPNKQITTGEGGLIVTGREDWAERMRSLRNQGRAPGDAWLEHSYLGYNYRLDEMSAALGLSQAGRLDQLLARRQTVADWYTERLGDIPGIDPPMRAPSTTEMSWFVYVVRLAPHLDRQEIIRHLEAARVPARTYFAPIHLQRYYVERFGYRSGDFPVAEELGRRGLALPFSSVMTESQVEAVCQALSESLRRAGGAR
jgi:perosamine synthetase